jgi:hypothetical protein
MIVLKLQGASSVDSLASTRTDPDIYKNPVYRDLSQTQPQNGSEVSSGKFRVCSHWANPWLITPCSGHQLDNQGVFYIADATDGAKMLCNPETVRGRHAKSIADLKMSS